MAGENKFAKLVEVLFPLFHKYGGYKGVKSIGFDPHSSESSYMLRPGCVLISDARPFEFLLNYYIEESNSTLLKPIDDSRTADDFANTTVDHVFSLDFRDSTLQSFTKAGFLCMGIDLELQVFPHKAPITFGGLLAKMHEHRCLVKLDGLQQKPHKNTLRRLARVKLTFDKDFDGVVRGLEAQHQRCWINGGLYRAYKAMSPGGSSARDPAVDAVWHSVESWEDDVLVAGELGVVCGKCYTSLSGFHTTSNSGSNQLLALRLLLTKEGFAVWDLGMWMRYKMDQGAVMLPRDEWRATFKKITIDADGTPFPPISLPTSIEGSELRRWYKESDRARWGKIECDSTWESDD